MVAASNGQVKAASLPELPSADSTRRGAQARVESVPDIPAEVTDSDGQRLRRWTLPAASGVLSGASLLHAQPPSLAQTWTRHRQAACHFEGLLFRGPRYAWGGMHVALKAFLYVVEWVTDSPVKFGFAVALVAACWFWS